MGKIQQSVIQTTREEKSTDRQQAKQEASRKKAIARQSLTQCTQNVTGQTDVYSHVKGYVTGQLAQRVDDLENTINRNRQLHVALNQQNITSKMSHQVIKIYDYEQMSRFGKSGQKISNDRPVRILDVQSKNYCSSECCWDKGCNQLDQEARLIKVKLDPAATARCLDQQLACIDTDNILHCLFDVKGETGKFFCSNVHHLRQQMEDKITNTKLEGAAQLVRRSAVESFVMYHSGDHYPEARKLKQQHQTHVDNWIELDEEIGKSENAKAMDFITKKSDDLESMPLALQYVSFVENNDEEQVRVFLDKCSLPLRTLFYRFREKLNWESEPVLREYGSFIEKTDTTLGLPEMKLIAVLHAIQIHMYQHGDDGRLEMTEAINPGGNETHHLLYEAHTESWQRLDINENRLRLEENRARQSQSFSQKLHSEKPVDSSLVFEQLKACFASDSEATRYVNKLNPKITGWNNVPSQLVARFNQDGGVFLSTSELSYLVESVLNAVVDDEAESLYSRLISRFCQRRWIHQLVVMDMENTLGQLLSEKPEFDQLLTNLYEIRCIDTLLLFQSSLISSASVSWKNLNEILRLLASNFQLTIGDVECLKQLSLNCWIAELKSKFWNWKVDQISSIPVEKGDEQNIARHMTVYMLIELENKFGSSVGEKILKNCRRQHLNITEVSELVRLSQYNDERDFLDSMAQKPLGELKKIVASNTSGTQDARSLASIISSMKNDSNTSIKPSTLEDIERLVGESQLISEENSEEKSYEKEVSKFLMTFDLKVKSLFGYSLRDTQRVAIATLLTQRNNVVAQVSTGEGKSLIVAGVAIFWA